MGNPELISLRNQKGHKAELRSVGSQNWRAAHSLLTAAEDCRKALGTGAAVGLGVAFHLPQRAIGLGAASVTEHTGGACPFVLLVVLPAVFRIVFLLGDRLPGALNLLSIL